jgi:hypothetical protein
MLMAISSSGAVTITGEMSGSDAANALLLDGTGSLAFATTASYNAFSASYAIASASLSSRTTQVEKTYANTGSNTFTGAQYVSDTSNGIGFTSTASFYTDGGLRVGKNAYVSGTAYFNNIVVFGTSSIQYITSSQVNIGANIITVNTDTPAVRFGGLSVFDSGSTQLTGSMLWDSEKNHWVYSNPSGSSYSGGMFISGPRSSALGSEQGTTSCMLLVGQGGDHLTSSMIYHDTTYTSFYSNALYVSSNGNVGIGSLAPTALFEVCRNQNSPTSINLTNACTGTSAHVNLQLGNSSGSNVAGLALFGSGYTNSNLYLADGLYVYNNRLRGGIVVATEQCTDIILGTNSTERWRLYCNGSVLQKTGSYTIDSGVVGRAGILISPEGTNCNSGFTNIQTFYGSVGYTSPLVLNRYGGNVGIGTSTPTNILHISGSGTNTQTLVLEGSSATANAYVVVKSASKMYFSGLSTDQSNNFIIYDSTAATTRMAITSGGNVGIGTTTPLSPFTVFKTSDAGRGGEISIVNGGTSAGTEAALNFGFGASSYDANNGNAQIKAVFTGGNEVTDLAFTTWTGGAFSEKMRIMGSGNVGIGTTSPDALLSVTGTIYARKIGGTSSTAAFQVRGAGGGPRIQTYGLDADQNAWMGLGTDMAGNPYEHSLYFSAPSSNSLGRQTIGSYDGTTYSTKMTILRDGSIGAPTGTNIYNPSDVRLKQNVTTITDGLDKIIALNPVKFNWVENFSPDEQGKDMLGFIAQEVESIIPEAVEGFSDGSSIIVGETTVDNPLRVNEKFIIPVLVKAIQEQQCKIALLESCLGIS